MQPVQYGSIFLFRNGFRILPFGDLGDDSWQLDFRNQQGYNRFLGTRDLFGRVDVITDDINEFKEVSSRDGGLINTKSAQQLFKFFEIAHRRLERYVVGVLWGEGFLKREYFNNEADALLQRKLLQENDKDSESVKYAFSNIGSKVDFVQLIKTLAKDPNIQVLYFNKDLADFVTNVNDSNLIKVQFISDLEKIASETNNSDLLFNIEEAKKKLEELQKEKEFAEERAKEEERKRIDAELKTKEAERARVYAEQKRQEEERARILAQLKAKEESQKAKEAELKHREEMIRRKEAEQKQKEEEAKRIEAEKERDAQKNKNQYLSSTRNITKEAEDIMHTILISSNELKAATEMIANIAKQLKNKTVHEQLEYLRFHIERINILSRLLTKADIVLLKASTKVDVKKYIKEYLINYNKTLEISFEEKYSECIIKKIPLLNLSVVLDNLISNSQKAGAKKLHISFSIKGEKTILVDFSDNGKGVDLNNFSSKTIFEEGVTNRIGGSGIGLSTIKDEMKKDLHGDIDFIGNGLFFKKGATFRLIFE